MLVIRDILAEIRDKETLESILLWGPRQVGKTTLLTQLGPKTSLFLDDLALRTRAQNDPGLALENVKTPALIDEVQYAPNIFPEIKLRIDKNRRAGKRDQLFFLTGSNRTLLDKAVKESLAGRCSHFVLLGFSVKELLKHDPELTVQEIMFKGGFPELYVRPELSVTQYLNDYITAFVQKDIAQSAGIEKMGEFQTVLQLLAARSGQFIQYQEISNSAGVDNNTVKRWVSVLEQNMILKCLKPYSSNLSKRIVKMPKLFFYDTGLCARLQGHSESELLWNSPHAGALFESLVFAELEKTRINYLKDWKLYTWRTKAKDEIDFILESSSETFLIEVKMGIHNVSPFALDPEAKKVFTQNFRKLLVTVGGQIEKLSQDVTKVPIGELGQFLIDHS